LGVEKVAAAKLFAFGVMQEADDCRAEVGGGGETALRGEGGWGGMNFWLAARDAGGGGGRLGIGGGARVESGQSGGGAGMDPVPPPPHKLAEAAFFAAEDFFAHARVEGFEIAAEEELV
jgi:hypothetical protein